MAVHTLTLEFESTEEDCGALLLEVPQSEVSLGDTVEFRLWGDISLIKSGWALYMGTAPLGVGKLVTPGTETISKQFDFAEANSGQFDYPINRVTHVTSLTELLFIEDDVPHSWAMRGENITKSFQRLGYSCLQARGDLARYQLSGLWLGEVKETEVEDKPAPLLYGSIQAHAERVGAYRSWEWTVSNKYAGTVWFFLKKDDVLFRKFSIALPELASATKGYRNIRIWLLDDVTEAPIPGGDVYLDDNFVGVTNSEGYLDVNEVLTGAHGFRAEASGYTGTADDDLSNDKIEVV